MPLVALQKGKMDMGDGRKTVRARWAAILGASLALSGLGSVARADTFGYGTDVGINGNAVLSVLGFGAPIILPSDFDSDDPQAVDLTGASFSVLFNDYLAIVAGRSGTFGVSYDAGQIGNAAAFTAGHDVAGMLSFGNRAGSLRTNTDDLQGLNGFGTGEFFNGLRPIGYGVWPLASSWADAGFYDYSSYVTATVDGAAVNVGFDPANSILQPRFRDGLLTATYRVSGGNAVVSDGGAVVIEQDIKILRATARMEWRLKNYDSAAPHTVWLRFVVNNHFITRVGSAFGDLFFVDDSQGGVTDRSIIYGLNPDGTAQIPIPDQINIHARRFDDNTIPPFSSRHTLRGFGATQPSIVYVGDSDQLDPGETFFPRSEAQGRELAFEDGAATAVYFGPFTLPAGGGDNSVTTVVTYYGNGASTERLEQDFVVATEADEAFQYNANAANNTNLANLSATEVVKQFLTPTSMTVFGSIYNRTGFPANTGVNLDNVAMNLVLPSGLQFAVNPNTGATDTSQKVVGTILPDKDAIQSWTIEPTGDTFGSAVYQMTASVGGGLGLARSVSRAITIPATPVHPVTASGYQMIGFPFQFDPLTSNNGDPATVVNGLTRPSDDPVAFYKWTPDPNAADGVTGKYELVSSLEPGVGYFYRPNLNRTLVLKGVQPVPDQASTAELGTPVALQRTLERGWNMISNPFLYNVPVKHLRFVRVDGSDPNNNLQSISFSSAVDSGIVRGGIFFFNPSTKSYDFFESLDEPLQPYQAYWIYLTDRRIMRYASPSQKQSAVIPDPIGQEPPTKKKVIGAIGRGTAFVAQPQMNNWKLQLVAQRDSGANDKATIIGVTSKAKDGDDVRDFPKPPAIVADYVAVGVVRDNGNGTVSRMAQDMKAPGGTKSWEIEVSSDKDGPVTLTWPNMQRMPKRLRLKITDPTTGRTTDLRNASSTIVNVSKDKPSRFVITADTQASRPLAITNFKVVKGTRAQGGGSNYSFDFNLTSDAVVTGRVMSLSGKTMSTFASSRAMTAGDVSRMSWNGRAQDGATLAAGIYTVEISAQAEGSQNAIIKRPIVVLR